MSEKNEQGKRFKMFTAGPVNVSQTVKDSMIYPEMGHREPEFENLYAGIRAKLLEVFRADSSKYSSFVIGGSGTAGMETVLSSVIHPGRKVLVINNGAFGDRMAEICKIHEIPTIETDYRWGQYPDLKGIEAILHKSEVEAISMAFLETSTGMSNPVREVGQLAKKYGKTFIVDAVSGLAGDYLDVQEFNIDFCFSNTNKGLSGLPALSFVCARKNAVEKIKDISPRTMYLNLMPYYKYAEKSNQTPFTPQIPLFFMLDQSLNELLEEGLDARHERYRENSALMRSRLKNLGFRFQLPERQMSNVMTNVLIPQNYEYEEFHTPLKEEGYIIYPGKGPLDGKVLHIANVGTHTKDDVSEFCDALEKITSAKRPEY